MTSLHQLPRTSARARQRVGRGGRRGKTAGRGTKGQNARAGRKKRPEMRDIIKKLPKRRGFGKNRGRTVVGNRPRTIPVSLTRVVRLFDSTVEITPTILAERLSLSGRGARKMLNLKIVGDGTVATKLSIKGVLVSGSARAAIEKAGGIIA